MGTCTAVRVTGSCGAAVAEESERASESPPGSSCRGDRNCIAAVSSVPSVPSVAAGSSASPIATVTTITRISTIATLGRPATRLEEQSSGATVSSVAAVATIASIGVGAGRTIASLASESAFSAFTAENPAVIGTGRVDGHAVPVVSMATVSTVAPVLLTRPVHAVGSIRAIVALASDGEEAIFECLVTLSDRRRIRAASVAEDERRGTQQREKTCEEEFHVFIKLFEGVSTREDSRDALLDARSSTLDGADATFA